MKGKARKTAKVAIKKDEQRTRIGKREHREPETQRDVKHHQGMTMVDPWSMLLEQLLEEPAEDGAEDSQPTTKLKLPKKGRERDEQ